MYHSFPDEKTTNPSGYCMSVRLGDLQQDSSAGTHLLILTDLDGTLLDHHNYSWQPALRAIERVLATGHLIVPTTSKTLADGWRTTVCPGASPGCS